METPTSILNDEPNYKPAAWQEYSLSELGQWVHLLAKRSQMRQNPEKAAKDLSDAQAYLDMMKAHLDYLEPTE